MNRGLLIVISGASGTGKGTVVNRLLEKLPELAYSVSATTRQPRMGEVDGKNYYFIDTKTFEKMIDEGGFLEWAKVYDNYYGTPLAKINERRDLGQDVLLEIDTQGALAVMEKCPDGVFIFLLPPSLDELYRRIKGRGTESEDSLKKRMDAARKEIAVGRRYKYAVVNDEVEKAAERIVAIITAERCSVSNNEKIFEVLQ